MFAQRIGTPPVVIEHATTRLPFQKIPQKRSPIIIEDKPNMVVRSRFGTKKDPQVDKRFDQIAESDQQGVGNKYGNNSLFGNLYGLYCCITKSIAENPAFLLEMLKMTALLVIIIFQFLIYKSSGNYIDSAQFSQQLQTNSRGVGDLAPGFLA